jgi:hypothetical protein
MRSFRSNIRKKNFKPIAKWIKPQTNKDKELLLKHMQLDPAELEPLLSELKNEISPADVANHSDMYTFVSRLCPSLTVE